MTVQRLIESTRPMVRRLAAAYARSPEDREDLVQEIHLRCLRSAARLRNGHVGPVWIRRIALATCNDHLRRRYRERRRPDVVALNGTTPESRGVGPAAAVVRAEDRMLVRTGLEHLPERDRQALEWHAYDGLDAAEIARRLGVAHATARVLLFRARRRLAALLDASAPTLAEQDDPARKA
jgi:RNA polymerase sigma-70 factor (ECF subfamily)